MTSLLAAPAPTTGSQHQVTAQRSLRPPGSAPPRGAPSSLLAPHDHSAPPRQHQVRAHHEDDAAPHHVTCGAACTGDGSLGLDLAGTTVTVNCDGQGHRVGELIPTTGEATFKVTDPNDGPSQWGVAVTTS
ncbi:hypothetical protein Krad_2464 [Kineococcus radiotolerans SRS30216 = ATCC BAA-149]|uniref:Uncharacterized protein n=1 Tax=Kineococcus radiotolerans (strain ATCC BAA-149 / DSM 14245 / SRS30216) TaxID=266940 RepID=A6WAV1_KINRD|nr:hypothetical protein Krad_2464 [Kineococcus radiotolerans SRS30216 = ATCC BAA-149]